MSWFRKKDKYWSFVERQNGKEIQHYIGDDKTVVKMIKFYKAAVVRYNLRHGGKGNWELLPKEKPVSMIRTSPGS